MAIGKSIVDVLKSITGKNVETIADGLEEALSGGSGGGGDIFYVKAKNGGIDCNFSDLVDAFLNDKIVVINGSTFGVHLIGYPDAPYVTFAATAYTGGAAIDLVSFKINSDGTTQQTAEGRVSVFDPHD